MNADNCGRANEDGECLGCGAKLALIQRGLRRCGLEQCALTLCRDGIYRCGHVGSEACDVNCPNNGLIGKRREVR